MLAMCTVWSALADVCTLRMFAIYLTFTGRQHVRVDPRRLSMSRVLVIASPLHRKL